MREKKTQRVKERERERVCVRETNRLYVLPNMGFIHRRSIDLNVSTKLHTICADIAIECSDFVELHDCFLAEC